jgi:paraquat-inducible protein A
MVSSMTDLSGLTACPDCDLLIDEATVLSGQKSKCPRCGTTIRIFINNSVDKTIALSLTGLLLFIPAMFMPIMTLGVMGMRGSGSVIDAMAAFFV